MIVRFEFKGGKGSGNFDHAGRTGKVGGSAPRVMGQGVSGGWVQKELRVWQGQQHEQQRQLTNIQTGNIGEEMAARAMKDKLGDEFVTLNKGITNAPIDIAGDHHAIEVKAGPASNGKSAQHWRATIATEGKKERELVQAMSAAERREYNQYKQQQVFERKFAMLDEMSRIAGSDIKPATVGVILTPDGKTGDVFFFEGFHARIGWNQIEESNYVGTYTIDDPNIYKEDRTVLKGGKGSGNFGHAGRPGKVGGSGRGSSGVHYVQNYDVYLPYMDRQLIRKLDEYGPWHVESVLEDMGSNAPIGWESYAKDNDRWTKTADHSALDDIEYTLRNNDDVRILSLYQMYSDKYASPDVSTYPTFSEWLNEPQTFYRFGNVGNYGMTNFAKSLEGARDATNSAKDDVYNSLTLMPRALLGYAMTGIGEVYVDTDMIQEEN